MVGTEQGMRETAGEAAAAAADMGERWRRRNDQERRDGGFT
jgi:hypothetical protein